MTAVRLRAVLDTLPDYSAGRTPAMIAAAGGPSGAVKLSGNESPFPPLPGVLEALCEASELNRYPTPYADILRAALADLLGVDAEQVAPAGGSLQLCRSVVEATCDPGDEVIGPVPAFATYRMAAELAGARFIGVPVVGPDARRAPGLDMATMAAAVTDRTRAVFLCSPHNPTSTALSANEFTAFMDSVPSDTLVALDEAYTEFVSDPATVRGMDELARYPNLVLLRTFSKAYGLAGARIGYAVAAEPVAAALRRVSAPFAVSVPAEAAAVATLAPPAHAEFRRRLTLIIDERTRMLKRLRDDGHDAAASEANFVWITSPEALPWAQGLEQRGVITRPYPGLGLRVTIGTPADNDAFLRAFADVAGSSGR